VGAWKLRAIVYGMLAAVSALVLWQSGALAGEPEGVPAPGPAVRPAVGAGPPPLAPGPRPATATIPGSGETTIAVAHGQARRIDVIVAVECPRRGRRWVTWQIDVSREWRNVSFAQHGDLIELDAWRGNPDERGVALTLGARLHDGGESVSGRVDLVDSRRDYCDGGASFG
jgi:hypothetical protein